MDFSKASRQWSQSEILINISDTSRSFSGCNGAKSITGVHIILYVQNPPHEQRIVFLMCDFGMREQNQTKKLNSVKPTLRASENKTHTRKARIWKHTTM